MNDQKTIEDQIKEDIEKYPVILYMKGTKLMPQCGFSARVVEILEECGADFETRNVLESDLLRQGIKDFSNWPTIPQLYINGEFIGGCDIVTQMRDTGELQELLDDLQD